MIGKALYDELKNDAAVAALVGAKIRIDVADDKDALPFIVFHRISDVPFHHLGGASGVTVQRWQFDCCAATRLATHAIEDAVREALDGFQNATMGSGENTHFVQRCHKAGAVDQYTPSDDEDEYGVFVTSVDYEITGTESVPTFA